MKKGSLNFVALKNINNVLLFFVLLFVLLYYGRVFLIPVVTSALLAMLLVPVCRRLETWGWKRGWAACSVVLCMLLLIVGVLYVLVNELIGLGRDIHVIAERLRGMLDQAHAFVSEQFQVSKGQQKEYLHGQITNWANTAGKLFGDLVFSFVGTLGNLLVVTVYTILMLIYRGRMKRFILDVVSRYAGEPEVEQTKVIVEKITLVASRYVGGIFLVVLILSVLYFIGLTIIGVENALFFAILAALINIIPYIGSVAGGAIVVLYTLITGDTLTLPLVVAVFFAGIQQLDSYVLTPKITGGKVRLGPLFTIMALLLGGMLWGVAGMVLFIPILGICKVAFDHVEPLKPYGYLIGD
ncbi:AI-2E family transporter [Sphingobacterium suaedae]|uniref:AI-2E family transporter n=1 Tax=Sphingobacterium suaedae TaxID=1686402 RepID=A0ABW5KBX7_9SPHI